MICVGLGAWNAVLRICASLCASCLCCAHFGLIVATGVYRFSDKGQLCALSKLPTNWTSKDEVDDDWTYEKDGELIFAIWIIQLCFFVCCCGVACFPIRNAYK